MRLNELTVGQATAGLRKREFSALELTRLCLTRIAERNEGLNAFITVCADSALAEAKTADKIIKRGEAKPLTGIPFAVKDAISTRGVRSTAAAKILDNYIPLEDATVVRKIREQGAVLLGKNNCDAFGHGASNENSMYGSVRNPYDTTRVAGGSSGGSAAAVADNLCLFAVGEDTGGSIRQPASFCGVVGLRPTYGRNSRYGIMPMASSMDTVGPLTKTAFDAALLMEVTAGHDPLDATTVREPVPSYTKDLDQSLKGLRVGVPNEYFELSGMDAETRQIVEAKVNKLLTLGSELVPVSLPYTKYAISVYYIIVPSEDSSNLARLEGIRFGERAAAKNLYDTYSESRAQGFPPEVKRRIMIGTYALSSGYYDAYYKKAQRVRTLIIRDFEQAFSEVDVLATPTSPFPAFKVGEKSDDILAMYLADIFVSPASVAGLPALSLPAGRTAVGLPVGLQLIGPRFSEGLLLRVGHQITV